MDPSPPEPSTRLAPLALTWLGLVLLTLLSLMFGEWFSEAAWLPLLVGALIWLKAWLVAHYFLEATLCRTFIRRLLWIFIAFAPIALAITGVFGPQIAAVLQL